MTFFKKVRSLPKKTLLIILAGIVLATGTTYVGVTKYKQNQEEASFKPREREYIATKGNITAGVKGAGTLKSETVKHNFDEPVVIGEVFVKVGQRVKKGDKLVSISQNYLKGKLDELTKNLNEATLTLEQAKGEKESTLESESNLSDTKKKALNMAISNAEQEVKKIKEDINKINKLKNTPILYSKTEGVVYAINNTEGASTTIEASIVDIGASSNITVEVAVSQNDIINIEEGQEVKVNIATYQDEEFIGKVKFVNLKPNSEGNTTTYSAVIELDKTDYELLDGMTVTAQFIIKEVKDVVMLSNKAIVLKDGKQFVKLKNKDGSIKEVNIQTGFSDGKNTEITSGINEGDTVIVGG